MSENIDLGRRALLTGAFAGPAAAENVSDVAAPSPDKPALGVRIQDGKRIPYIIYDGITVAPGPKGLERFPFGDKSLPPEGYEEKLTRIKGIIQDAATPGKTVEVKRDPKSDAPFGREDLKTLFGGAHPGAPYPQGAVSAPKAP